MKKFFCFSFTFLSFSFFSLAENLPTSGTLLWRVSGNGLKEISYLYGTMHTRDTRAFHFSDSVLNCFMRCKSFAMELKMEELNNQEVIGKMMLDSGATIGNILSKEQYDSLQKKTQEITGFSISLFERLKPIFIATILSQGELLNDSVGKNPNQYFLDEYFEVLARHSGKNVSALEMVQTQLDVFNFLPIAQQVDYLMKSIRGENGGSGIDTFISHYANGELEILLKSDEDDLLSGEFLSKILTERNEGMANHIESLMRSQSLFAAFGAAHLTGDSGIISLLRKKGYTVEPVVAAFDDISAEGWLYVFPCSVIAVAMPGLPVLITDTLFGENINYTKWFSKMNNAYSVIHFTKNIAVTKSLLTRLSINEIDFSTRLKKIEGDFPNRKNIRAYKMSATSDSENLFVIENGSEKIIVIVTNENSIDDTEMKRFLSLVRYKIASPLSY